MTHMPRCVLLHSQLVPKVDKIRNNQLYNGNIFRRIIHLPFLLSRKNVV